MAGISPLPSLRDHLLAEGLISGATSFAVNACVAYRLEDEGRLRQVFGDLSREDIALIGEGVLGSGIEGEFFASLRSVRSEVVGWPELEPLSTAAKKIYLGNISAVERITFLKEKVDRFMDRFLVFKGIAFQHHFPRRCGMRRLADIDLLLNPASSLPQALVALKGVGIEDAGTLGSLRAFFAQFFYNIELNSKEFGVVDLHVAFRRHFALHVDYHQVWARSEIHRDLGVRVLSLEDELLSASLSLLFDLFNGKFDHKKAVDCLSLFSKAKASQQDEKEEYSAWIHLANQVCRTLFEDSSDRRSGNGRVRQVTLDLFNIKIKRVLFPLMPGGGVKNWCWFLRTLPLYTVMVPRRIWATLSQKVPS